MNFCIPYLTIEPLIPKLSAPYWHSALYKAKTNEQVPVSDLKIEAQVYCKGEALSLQELYQLENKSIIKLPEFSCGSAYLNTGGKDVIKLKQQGTIKRKALLFIIEESREQIEEFIPSTYHESAMEKSKQADITNMVQDTLMEMKEELTGSIKQLYKKIAQISDCQDKLADQLYFSILPKDVAEHTTIASGPYEPFSFIRVEDVESLYNIIQIEHPQTIALILSDVEAHIASYVLGKMPTPIQVDVAERVATIDKIAPQVLKAVEHIVEKKLRDRGYTDLKKAGGLDSLINILSLASRSLEIDVIKTLEKQNPELATNIKNHLFMFEDVVLLDSKTIQHLLKKIKREDLLLALKTVDEKVKNHF